MTIHQCSSEVYRTVPKFTFPFAHRNSEAIGTILVQVSDFVWTGAYFFSFCPIILGEYGTMQTELSKEPMDGKCTATKHFRIDSMYLKS